VTVDDPFVPTGELPAPDVVGALLVEAHDRFAGETARATVRP